MKAVPRGCLIAICSYLLQLACIKIYRTLLADEAVPSSDILFPVFM